MGHPNQSLREEIDCWLNSVDQFEMMQLADLSLPIDLACPRTKIPKSAIELRSESFHCGISADNFTSLSIVQSYLCSD